MSDELQRLALKVVDLVSKTILRESKKDFFRMSKTVDLGADGTPTKVIDKIAEEKAIKVIKNAQIPVNILSEEAGFIDLGGSDVFVIDPVDGTRNAYRGIPFYAVSVAIGSSCLSDVRYGVVKNVPTGDVFTAEREKGAFVNGHQIAVCEMPSQDMVSSLSLGKNADETTRSLSSLHNVRSLGSASLEMCMVATGALDFYLVGHDHLRVIDIAASTLIAREAGGVVCDIYGRDLEMDFDLHKRTSLVTACSYDLVQKLITSHKR